MPRGERTLMVLFLVLAAGAAVLSLGFELPEARLFPLITGIVTSGIILGYLIVIRMPKLRKALGPFLEDDLFMKISAAADRIEEGEAAEARAITHPASGTTDEERRTRERRFFAYLGGFGILAWLVGLSIASPIFLFAVIFWYSHESLKRALIVTAATTLFLHLVFVQILSLPMHLGLLGNLI